MILRQNNDGHIDLTADGLAMDKFKKLSKLKNIDDILKYIYYNYDPDSNYFDMLPSSREILVNREILGGKELKINEQIQECIDIYRSIVLDPRQVLYEGFKKKMDEYLKWWQDIKITDDNHDTIFKSLQNAERLLTIDKKLENQVMENKSSRDFGGGRSTMFED